MSTFTDIRTPLTRIQDRFENIDMGCLLGEEAETEAINSFNIGRALERLGDKDSDGLYETIALSAIQMNEIPLNRLHADTTTISFYGEYDVDAMNLSEEDKEELLQIERGYNKDGRPQCNQAVMGQIVNEAGIPLVSRVMDGSTSDVEWNKKAVQYLDNILTSGFEKGIFVADSKLVTSEIIRTMSNPEKRIQFVSRCPASFEEKLEKRMIEKAYAADQWEEIGQLHDAKNAAGYRGISFIETVCGYPMRLLVLQSSALAAKAKDAIEKERDKLKPLIQDMEKKKFLCQADAEQERERFRKLKQLRLFDCTYTITKESREVWPRGRHGAKTQPRMEESYQVCVLEIKYQRGSGVQLPADRIMHCTDKQCGGRCKQLRFIKDLQRSAGSRKLISAAEGA